MKILLLSAYDAHSHRYWRESLVDQFEQYQWTVLSLPPRFFSYRVRANPMTWFIEQRTTLSADYDLIIATSMVVSRSSPVALMYLLVVALLIRFRPSLKGLRLSK